MNDHHHPSRRTLLKLAPAGVAAGWGWPFAAHALDAGATSALLRARLADRGVGLVAVQVQGDQVMVSAQGLARQGETAALRDDALFEIGSITKTFTALLLADAVVRGQLALDGAVQDALPPGVPLVDAAGDPIRWIDLATHRSGLPRLPANMAPSTPADPYNEYREADLLAFLKGFKPTVARGVRFEYSNLGFGLMGYALGRAAGSNYPQLLAGRVLQPLGLTDAYLALPGRRFDRLATGHDAQRRPVEHWHLDVLAGAGALAMSGATLGRYAQAAIGVIDSPLHEAFALAEREHAGGQSAINPIGLAWNLAGLNGRRVLNHDGGTAGFSSSLWLDPTRRRATAVLANAAVEVNDLALHLLDESVPTTDFSLTRQTAIEMTPTQLAPLAGTYALNAKLSITISVRDGELWAQATGQGPFRLFAATPRRFFAKVTPLQVEFDEGDPPKGFALQQGGRSSRFVRDGAN
jgi:CubicO group peptidase (beta-lactamase class C family)